MIINEPITFNLLLSNKDLSFIRRSRGYNPEPYKISYDCNDKNVLALGPELDVTFAIAKDNLIYPL